MNKKPRDIILHMHTKNHDHVMHGSWNIRRKSFFFILGYFLPFHPPNLKNQNFGKMKKTPGDVIILHLCNTNDNHMMYSSWNVECNR